MADTVHPLFATRGVPGTHDLTLLHDTINALRGSQGEVAVPGFDKAADDRTEMVHWRQESAPVANKNRAKIAKDWKSVMAVR